LRKLGTKRRQTFRRAGEAPKTVKIFVNSVALGFDSASTTPAAQVFAESW
jgi:hypothetical protein